MSNKRRDTDCVGIPIDVSKITPKVKPWTKEEAERERLKYKAEMAKRRKESK